MVMEGSLDQPEVKLMNITSVLTLMLLLYGCGSPSEQLSNRQQGIVPETTTRSEPFEVSCTAEQEPGGRTVVHYQVRNIGRNPVYVADSSRMPYEVVRDDVLVVLHGVNAPEPGRIYEIYTLPKIKAVMPGEIVRGEAELGKAMLRDHFHLEPAPTKFLHGKIRVACAIGWGATPIARPDRTPFAGYMTWQHITKVEPFEVVLP